MRKYLIVTIANIILIFLQESFLVEFFGIGLNPNLVIILGYAFLVIEEEDLALFSMLIGGLFLDLLSTGVIGLSSLFFVLLMLISLQVRRTIYRGALTQLVFVVITAVTYKILASYPPFQYQGALLVSGLLDAVLVVILAQVLGRFKQRYISTEFRIRA